MDYKIIPHQETQTKPLFTNNSPFLIPTTSEINFNIKEPVKEYAIQDK